MSDTVESQRPILTIPVLKRIGPLRSYSGGLWLFGLLLFFLSTSALLVEDKIDELTGE